MASSVSCRSWCLQCALHHRGAKCCSATRWAQACRQRARAYAHTSSQIRPSNAASQRWSCLHADSFHDTFDGLLVLVDVAAPGLAGPQNHSATAVFPACFTRCLRASIDLTAAYVETSQHHPADLHQEARQLLRSCHLTVCKRLQGWCTCSAVSHQNQLERRHSLRRYLALDRLQRSSWYTPC